MVEMKVLVVGGGGREHALCWKIAQSPLVSKVFCAPGNDGIAQIAECVPGIEATDVPGLIKLTEEEGIGLAVVGPEAPLVNGIVDEFQAKGLRIFGPTKAAALLEGSKVFAKKFMRELKIPTADFRIFDKPDQAKEYASKNLPCVIKADGLAAGKGAIPCFSRNGIWTAIRRIMIDEEFGKAGKSIVVEQFLKGEEATFKILTDGKKIIPMLSTQDHKPVYDNDKGPNTGGMGAYAPAPVITPVRQKEIMKKIVVPTINGMAEEGNEYRGVLYFGLIITVNGPMVLEFNVRFGDPELQPLVLLMENDIVPILEGVADGWLLQRIEWNHRTAVCVVMASEDYPERPRIGKKIIGLEEVAKMKDVVVFHAGTKEKNGKIVTDGGRVLGVTALGDGIKEAKKLADKAVSKISWPGEHHRTDIAEKALGPGV